MAPPVSLTLARERAGAKRLRRFEEDERCVRERYFGAVQFERAPRGTVGCRHAD